MNGWILVALIAAAVLAIWAAQRFGWIDLSNKSTRSGSSGVMTIGDEVFAPTRHEAQIEMDRQTSMPAPAPVPGDGPGENVYDGRVRIDLSSRR